MFLKFIQVCITSLVLGASCNASVIQSHESMLQEVNLPRLLQKNPGFKTNMHIFEDEKGELAFEKYFEHAGEFSSNGLAAVKVNDKWGYINTKGDQVIPSVYDNAFAFSVNNIARVVINNKQGFINTKGELVIPAIYDEAKDFALNGMARVKVGEAWGYINTSGKMVIAPKFFSAADFSNGFAAVGIRSKGFFGGINFESVFINEAGEIVISDDFIFIGNFAKNGLAPVQKYVGKNDFGSISKYGYINREGEMVIPLKFSHATDFSEDGLAVVMDTSRDASQGKLFIINEKGDEVSETSALFGFKLVRGQLIQAHLRGGYGYVNDKGRIIIPPQFEYASEFKNGIAVVQKKDRTWSYINFSGEEYSSHAYNALKKASNGEDFLRLIKSKKYKVASNIVKWNTTVLPVEQTEKAISEDPTIFRLFKSYANGKCIRFNYDKKKKEIVVEDYFAECKEPSFYSKSDKVYDFMKYSDQFWNANISDYSNTRLIPYDIDNKSFSVYVSEQLDLSEWVQATVMSVGVMGVFDIASRISGHGGMMNEHKLNPDAVSIVHKTLLKNTMSLTKDKFIKTNKKAYLDMMGSQDVFKLKFTELPTFFTTPMFLDYFKYSGFHLNWRLVNNKARFTIHAGTTGKEIWWDFDLKSKKVASNEYERGYGFMWVNRGKFRKDTYEIVLPQSTVQIIEAFKAKAISTSGYVDDIIINTRQFLPKDNKLIYENETLLRCLNCDRPIYSATLGNNKPANPSKNIWKLIDSSTTGGLVTRREHTDKYEISCKNGKTGTMYHVQEYEKPWGASGWSTRWHDNPDDAADDACR